MKREHRGLGWSRGTHKHSRDEGVEQARRVEPTSSHSAALKIFNEAARLAWAAPYVTTGWCGKVT